MYRNSLLFSSVFLVYSIKVGYVCCFQFTVRKHPTIAGPYYITLLIASASLKISVKSMCVSVDGCKNFVFHRNVGTLIVGV
jgi:hypothetical protein